MSTWQCTGCTTVYSVGAQRCPQCRTTEHQEDVVPKTAAEGGPSYAGFVDTSTAETLTPDWTPVDKQAEASADKQAEASADKQAETLIDKQVKTPASKQPAAPADKQVKTPASEQAKPPRRRRTRSGKTGQG